MFLQIIFRKLGIKEDQQALVAIYGGMYFAICLAALMAVTLFTGMPSLFIDFLISLVCGIAMCIVYAIKLQVYKLRLPRKRQ